jgi:hypothetical protein
MNPLESSSVRGSRERHMQPLSFDWTPPSKLASVPLGKLSIMSVILTGIAVEQAGFELLRLRV